MTSPTFSMTPPRARLGTGARIGIGILLLLPALLALVWSYVVPTGLAVARSTSRNGLRPDLFEERRGTSTNTGAAHYQHLFERGIVGEYGKALLLAIIPLVLALLVAPLLAVLADQAGRRARLATRALLAVPVAGYAPVALLIGWRLDRFEPGPADSEHAMLAELVAVGSGGLVVAVAATAFLGALRGRRLDQARPAAAVVAGLLVIGIIAATLQSFTAPILGSSILRASLPVPSIVTQAMTQMNFGTGAAEAVLLLTVLAVLGLAATALLLVSRARIEPAEDPTTDPDTATAKVTAPTWPTVTPTAEAATTSKATPVEGSLRARSVLAAVGTLAIALMVWVAWPWLRRSFRFTNEFGPMRGGNLPDLLAWTWLPPLLMTIVTISIAVAAGFAIGGLRPLGRYSELLLLPFAPWLFVGTGPLAVEFYLRTADLEQIGTFLGAVPPGWVSIPALFLFTLLFRGLEPRWRAGGGMVRTMIVPAAPMVLLAGLVTWLVSAGQLLWPWFVASTPNTRTATVAAVMEYPRIPSDEVALGAVLPLPILVVFLAALVLLQVRYLDRLAIRVGRQAEPQERH